MLRGGGRHGGARAAGRCWLVSTRAGAGGCRLMSS